MGKCEYWDMKNKIGDVTVTENFGNVVIGNSKGYFYELILFEECLSDEDLESIKKFIKTMYNFEVPVPKVKANNKQSIRPTVYGSKILQTVDNSLLQNLN